MKKVCIGLRAKTGRAVSVVLSGPSGSPLVLMRTELLLADPSDYSTVHPYHEVMDLSWQEGQMAVKSLLAKIEEIAVKSLKNLIRELENEDLITDCIAIVGAGDRSPGEIASPHIRAHAAEGLWFRKVLEFAARKCKTQCRVYDERSLNEIASLELGISAELLLNIATSLGKSAGRPWRADEKAATLGAWLALNSSKHPY